MSDANHNITTQKVGPTEWTAWTPTGLWTTNTTYEGYYRLLYGTTLECIVNIKLSGAPNSALLGISMPSGFTIDSSQIPGFGGATEIQGETAIYFGAGNWPGGMYVSSAYVYLTYSLSDGAVTIISRTAPVTFANGHNIRSIFRVPVVQS